MKKKFKAIIVVGLSALALLDLVSIIGIVYGLIIINLNILSVACSVFTAATSSILTIIALIMTFYFQKKDYENKISEQQVKNRNAINKVLDTLFLQNIFIKKSLVPNTITQINKSGDEHKNNLKITFEFSCENLNEIESFGIKNMKLVCSYFDSNDKPFLIRFDNETVNFIKNMDRKNNFVRLNVITGINLENYKSFTNYLDDLLCCALKINMTLKVLHSSYECVEKEINEKLNFQQFDEHNGVYIFERNTEMKRVC